MMFQKTSLVIGLFAFVSALACEEVVTSGSGGIMTKKLKDASAVGDDSGRRLKDPGHVPRSELAVNFLKSKNANTGKGKVDEAFGLASVPENSAITCLCAYSASAGKIQVKCKLPLQADWKTLEEQSTGNLKTTQCHAQCSQMKESATSMVLEEGVKIVWLSSICG